MKVLTCKDVIDGRGGADVSVLEGDWLHKGFGAEMDWTWWCVVTDAVTDAGSGGVSEV